MNSGARLFAKETRPMHQSVGRVDITGERIGTWTAVRPTGESCPCSGSRVWLLRCDCGAIRDTALSAFRSYQRAGKGYRCSCKTVRPPRIERPSRKPSIVEPRRRRSERFCDSCCGQSWRVVGIKCRECGLRYCDQPPIVLPIPELSSSMARALEFAPGGD